MGGWAARRGRALSAPARTSIPSHHGIEPRGPRKVGKSTLLRQRFPKAKTYDLLNSEQRSRLLLRPHLLREELLARKHDLVVIDEIQRVPALLDEVHWLIENTRIRFLLCGSSARKLRHGAANLLGGRAIRFELFPFTSHELGELDLDRALGHGLIPDHYLATKPERALRGYVLDYLEQEIQAEALTRNVPAFTRFLEAVGVGHGGLLNYANVGRDCGVSPKTVREYYQILEDTLLGHTLPPWRKAKKRRLIETSKFYLFDPGIVRALRGMHRIERGSVEFGQAFEHFLIEEVRAYLSYSEKHLPLAFWRTSTGYEVDLVVGDLDLALEFTSSRLVRPEKAKGLQALMGEHRVRRAVIVSLDPSPRKLPGGILVLPWKEFCSGLWQGNWV